jgi:hypothetical protein
MWAYTSRLAAVRGGRCAEGDAKVAPGRGRKPPKPFTWTATAEGILAKVARGRVALQAVTQN